MTTKERLLARLEASKGGFVSGESLACELGVSRNAIWKAARTLRDEGYRIDAATNRGYSLSFDSDRLSPSEIYRHLRNEDAFSLSVRRSVPSTNEWARERAQEGAPEGTVVVAEGQSAGRGRRGRPFFSPEGSGVYLSILLRPTLPIEKSHLLTCAAAVACARGIEAVSRSRAEIKWVNDVYCDGRKVAGILTEGSYCLEDDSFEHAVVGIGINVKPPKEGFPSDIADRAGSLFEEDGPAVRSRLVAAVMDEFWDLYRKLPDDSFRTEYRDRCFLIGRQVSASSGNRTVRGTVVDVDESFRLVVARADGVVSTLRFDEASVSLRS